MKRKSVATITVSDEHGWVREYEFDNGEIRKVDLATDIPDELYDKLMGFGLGTKLQNFYAGCKGDAKVAVEQFDIGLDRLKQGKWNKPRRGRVAKPKTGQETEDERDAYDGLMGDQLSRVIEDE